MMAEMSLRRISAWLCVAGLLLAFALAPLVIRGDRFRIAMGDVVPMLVLTASIGVYFRNARHTTGYARFFWALLTLSMTMWWANQAGWFWFEVVVRKPLPDPFVGDVLLFLHMVPLMAAVAVRPRPAAEDQGVLASTLNVFTLLVWWVLVYAFIIFPDEYVLLNLTLYNRNWDLLYLLEGLILITLAGRAFFASSGAWRKIYGNIFIGSVIYTFASEAMNVAIARKAYSSGSLFDLPFLLSLLLFFRAGYIGNRELRETRRMPESVRPRIALTPYLTKLALLSVPLMAYWALFMSNDVPYLRRVRFAVAMSGVAAMAFVVFLKQHLLDRRLVVLLKQSRQSYSDLQRLQGRAIQQEKLASLGELVALAAGELEYPLSTILENSEQLAASSRLHSEQLSTAQKIGQQARRTRGLVNDLLSFAQQSPGEKLPLDVKPLIQRAVQMESFKLEKRQITLVVRSEDPLPRVLGNSNQLLQAFLQIVENAVDALQEAGGGKLQITLRREQSELLIEFADTGPGLQNPERVFDPFYTTKPVGKGTGLGLSATYGVIQDHRGEISCYNRAEGGAVFEIRLPTLKSSAAITEAVARA